jgi:hypothetical protein
VWGSEKEPIMDENATDAVICALIGEVRIRLDQAASIAKAAQSCADSGNAAHAIQILMDFEGLAHDAQDLFKAALTIKRNLLPDSA